MNTLHYNAIGLAIAAMILAPASVARADDLESRLVDRREAIKEQNEELEERVENEQEAALERWEDRQEALDDDAELVPPAVPVAPYTTGPVYDGYQTVYRPVFHGRRFYSGPYYSYRYGMWPRTYRYYSGYPSYYDPYYGGYYPRYYRYYGTPRFGYYDYPYGGSARVGPLRVYWR